MTWHKKSWRDFPIKQQPEYESEKDLDDALSRLRTCPPLVQPTEINNLKKELALVAKGKAFLLQGGDCAESFSEFNEENLHSYFNLILQMTMALMYGLGKPVVKVGRIAGQFAKPRSASTEKKGDKEIPSYRGDIINSIEFEDAARKNNPENLIKAYLQSASTLNYLRSLAKGGKAGLSNINLLNKNFIKDNKNKKNFAGVIDRINEALKFMHSCRLDLNSVEELRAAEFYVSHEGLLLPYEESFVRFDEETEQHYACSAHLLWIGDRTRSLDEAHVEFFRGIANPVACKVGPSMQKDDLLKLINVLNPHNEPGKLTLISRMGESKVKELLPPFVEAVKKEGFNVIWSCDPMHGNTIKSPNGYKTRPFDDIYMEVKNFFEVHKQIGTHPGGVHFEMTGQDVTECLGGLQNISSLDLENRYHTHCDPRLNASQSLELAFLISKELGD